MPDHSILPMKPLSEVLSVVETGSRPSGGASSSSFGVPSLGGENVKLDGSLDLEDVRHVSDDFFISMRTGHLRSSDVLINKDGAQTGKVAIYSGEFQKAAINEHLYLLRGTSNMRQDYLFRVLLSENTQRAIRLFISGSAQPGLNRDFVNILVPVPNLDNQKMIAEVLEDLDQTVDLLQRIIIKYEGIRLGIISDLFNGLSNSVCAEVDLEMVTIFISRGSAPRYVAHSQIAAIGQRCIQDRGFVASAGRPHDESVTPRLLAQVGDVLVNSTGTGTIGRSCVFNEPYGRYMVDSHVTVVRADSDQIDPRILNELVKAPAGQKFLYTYCFTGSTNQIELSQAEFSKMPIRLLPLEEQRRIAGIIDDVDATIQSNRRQLEKLRQLRAGLAADLFSGKVRTVAM